MHRYALFIAALTAACSINAFAHEHWIDMSDFYPDANTVQKVFICSGHSFPESSIALKDRVLHDAHIIAPDGTVKAFEYVDGTKKRSAEVSFQTNGIHKVGFVLKQPQMKEPLHWAKALVVVDKKNDNPDLYVTKKGLEIALKGTISTLTKGDQLPLTVLYNGKQVDARLSIQPEQGKSIILSTTSKRPAILSISQSVRYLITTSYKGKSCSLTFAVQKASTNK